MKKLFIMSQIAIVAALILPGCGQSTSAETESKLTDEAQALQEKVDGLQQKIEMMDLFRTMERVAFLKPGDEGYSVIQSDIGLLTVALEDIKPYANGSKVTLNFGNTTAATVNGLKAQIDWGSVGEDGTPINEKAKSREVKFNETLRPGAWTRANVVLEGIPPAELGFIRLREVGHSGIRLSGR
jgi:hypothetical protein